MSLKAVKLFFLNIWAIRNIIIVLIAILAPINLISDDTKESKCAYGLIVMAVLWLTEALPIPVTALMPVILFPLLDVVPGKTICTFFLNDTSMLFIGGLIVAVAVEEVGLHNRIAMGIVSILGSNPNMLMLGLMLPTWFLSMWISNTAATSMMIPIIVAVMDQVREAEKLHGNTTDGKDNQAYTTDQYELQKKNGTHSGANDVPVSVDEIQINEGELNRERAEELKRFGKGLALSVAYGANAGGIATLTGTPPNLILQGQADKIYEKYEKGADSGITFANWMAFAFPLSVLILILCWLWLQIFFLRSLCCKKSDETRKEAIQKAIQLERKKLGRWTFGEIIVLICFISLALLWIFRWIPGFGGWANLFQVDVKGGPYARDSTAAMLIAIALFVLPRKLPNIFCWNKEDDKKPYYTPILTWETAVHKVPWGIIILLGGGFALAEASKISGLSKLVGCRLTVFSNMDLWVMNLVICLIVAAATEITSNSATATLLMPIMAELAISLGQHPLYLMISTAVACSFAFMLPVATPPNAIVFSTGFIRIPDMASAGIAMNVIAILGLTLAINTWAIPIFGLDVLPSIFNTTGANATCL
ncbi:SLC13A2_3_5 [Mytilus edulis]|uniref:SLC13A2_3_5 n=1 Tax=Mytilus edulis TaxID=6550 RepID=A0A8S3QEM5_MYTED|nr:SLC13A2_3_5 [Mytilus edulis]